MYAALLTWYPRQTLPLTWPRSSPLLNSAWPTRPPASCPSQLLTKTKTYSNMTLICQIMTNPQTSNTLTCIIMHMICMNLRILIHANPEIKTKIKNRMNVKISQYNLTILLIIIIIRLNKVQISLSLMIILLSNLIQWEILTAIKMLI